MRILRAAAAAWGVLILSLWGTAGMIRGGIVHGTSLPGHSIVLPEGIPDVDRAVQHFKDGDLAKCRALLKSVVAGHPELPSASLLFAALCQKMDQAALGREALEEAVVENPNLPESYLLLGRLALLENRLTDAQLQYDKAMSLVASSTATEPRRRGFEIDVHAGLAAVAERRKDWPAAAENLTAWLKLDPKNGRARQQLAVTWYRQGQHDKVEAGLVQAAKDDPSLEPAPLVLAMIYGEDGNLQKAAEWMEYAVKASPDNAKVRLTYAAWLFEHDRAESAKVHAEAAVRLDPSSHEIRVLRGLIAWQSRDYSTAERMFQELHLENPGSLAVSNLWALSLAEQTTDAQRKRALELAKLNAQLYPNSPEALTTLGWVEFRLGNVGKAEQTLRAALASGKANSDTAYYYARVLSNRQKDEEVERWLKVSLDAPGRFAFRAEAKAWLDQLQKKRGR